MLREGSRWRSLGLGLVVSLAGMAGCGPVRMGFDVVVPPSDGTVRDNSVEPDVEGDAPQDAPRDARRDAVVDTAPMCTDEFCSEVCINAGAREGFCRANGMCFCVDLPDGAVVGDATMPPSDGGSTGPVVTGCGTNEDCPPSMFCNGTDCDGRGYCAFRGEERPELCPMSSSPSCGCDGRLYPSVCMRLASGVRQGPRPLCGSGDAGASDARPSDAGGSDATADAGARD